MWNKALDSFDLESEFVATTMVRKDRGNNIYHYEVAPIIDSYGTIKLWNNYQESNHNLSIIDFINFTTNLKKFTSSLVISNNLNLSETEKLQQIKRLCKVVIKYWGGIAGISTKTIETYAQVCLELIAGKDPEECFNKYKKLMENISSFSKILAFTLPKSYFIYDARIALLLNKLLLQSSQEYPFGTIPLLKNRSQNSSLNEILNNPTIKVITTNMSRTIYRAYCSMIRSIYDAVKNKKYQSGKISFMVSDPQMIETILFMYIGIQLQNNKTKSK